eukprot:m.77360 g.77360  ORF g.77360 m.77360 type:complete len:126 (+) comp17282_c0_seq3:724-1101(+)
MWTHSKGSFFSVAFFGGVWVGSSRQALRQALLFPEDFVLHYKTFADTLKDGSMYRNAQTFMSVLPFGCYRRDGVGRSFRLLFFFFFLCCFVCLCVVCLLLVLLSLLFLMLLMVVVLLCAVSYGKH